MDTVVSAIERTLAILVQLGVSSFVWIAARHFARPDGLTSGSDAVLAYGRVWVACVFIALLAWASYGTHVEDSDPLFGGGTIVEDFVPSDQGRAKHAYVVFFVTFAVASHGTWYGRNR